MNTYLHFDGTVLPVNIESSLNSVLYNIPRTGGWILVGISKV